MNDQNENTALQQLMIDKLTNQISAENDQLLSASLEADPALMEQWEQLQKAYAYFKTARFERDFDADKSWKALHDRTFSKEKKSASVLTDGKKQERGTVIRPHFNSAWRKYGIAAALILALALPFYLNRPDKRAVKPISDTIVELYLPNGNKITLDQGEAIVKGEKAVLADKTGKAVLDAQVSKIDPFAANTLSVPAGKNFEMTLSDGSQVWLNAASTLNFPLQFRSSKREVALQGEAFFKVAHNPAQPFIVTVNGMKVQVLGTEFNIKAYPGEKQQAALIKGKVTIQNSIGKQVTLQPGQQALIKSGNPAIEIGSFDPTVVLGWMNGMYYFQDEELKDIVQTIQRWFDVKISFSDPAIGNLHFTGALNKNNSLKDFLSILAKTSGTQYSIEGNTINFSR